MATGHRPVLLEEAVTALQVGDGAVVVDATFGGGGHTRRVLAELGPGGAVIGVDRDPEAAARAEDLRSDGRFSFVAGPFDEALGEMSGRGERVDAVLFDLGLSSFQIDDPGRGFSYVAEGPLDMRMDPGRGVSAAEYLNGVEVADLIVTLVQYGDVPRGEARRVAREILRRRPLSTTTALHDAVRAAVGWKERGGNPAKRIFQAVRVRVNDELGSVRRALEATERLLVPGGRLVPYVPLRGGPAGETFHLRAGGPLRLPPGPARLRLRGEPDLPSRRGAQAIRGGDAGEPAQRLREVALGDQDRGTRGGRLMAAPHRWYRSTLPTEPAWPAWEGSPGRRPAGAPRKRQGRNRRFAVLVVVPVLLMLGSVYLHTVSSGLEARTDGLQHELDATRALGERLEVEVAKLSAADRVRPFAREELGMTDAGSAELEVFKGGEREDGTTDAGAKRGGGQR